MEFYFNSEIAIASLIAIIFKTNELYYMGNVTAGHCEMNDIIEELIDEEEEGERKRTKVNAPSLCQLVYNTRGLASVGGPHYTKSLQAAVL